MSHWGWLNRNHSAFFHDLSKPFFNFKIFVEDDFVGKLSDTVLPCIQFLTLSNFGSICSKQIFADQRNFFVQVQPHSKERPLSSGRITSSIHPTASGLWRQSSGLLNSHAYSHVYTRVYCHWPSITFNKSVNKTVLNKIEFIFKYFPSYQIGEQWLNCKEHN